MFDPVTMGLGAALTGGSVIANIFADEEQRKARELAERNALFTDLAFQGRSNQINDQARGRFANFGTDMAAKARELSALFGGAAQPGGAPPGSVNVPPIAGSTAPGGVLGQERAKQMSLANLFNEQQGGALGDLRSFDQTLGAANRGVARDALSLGQNLSAQRGAMNLLPQQLADAQEAGGFAGLLGDLARGGGQIALSAGMRPAYFGSGSYLGLFPSSFSQPNPGGHPFGLASMFA